MLQRKLNYRITCVSRMAKEQMALYAQGRECWVNTNLYRSLAGLPKLEFDQAEYDKIVDTFPGVNKYVVTWTLKSFHVCDVDDGNPDNDLSRAFDIVMLDSYKKATFDLKVDVDKDGVGDYLEAAKCGRDAGLVVGADFKNKKGQPNPDYPHFQSAVAHG